MTTTKTFHDGILITGATGLVGSHVLRRLLATESDAHFFVLVRDAEAWRSRARLARLPERRITPVAGDLTASGLGLSAAARALLRRRVRLVVHSAADTVFSRSLPEARAVNTEGTVRVARLAEECPGVERFVHVSTAFVAGRLQGLILERDNEMGPGFVNGYEQSKHEAERVVRGSRLPWVVVRPSAIVCDGPDGHVSQFNAVHRALRLYHNGLASMMPGEESNPVDVVSVDYVAACVSELARARDVVGGTFHACSGDRALTLGGLLDTAYEVWCESPEWRRRAIPRPALTDLATYRLFEQAVEDTGDERLRTITRSLSHFVPQLAMPKVFDTSRMERVMGAPPPPAAGFWGAMIRHMIGSRWAAAVRRAA